MRRGEGRIRGVRKIIRRGGIRGRKRERGGERAKKNGRKDDLRNFAVTISHVFILCVLYILHSARPGVILFIPVQRTSSLLQASLHFELP